MVKELRGKVDRQNVGNARGIMINPDLWVNEFSRKL